EDGIRDFHVTGVQTCALPIWTRQVHPFTPLAPPKVGIYTCGPTVYAPQHLGNMRSQLFPDLLRRVLLAAGYDVTYVTNITDVGQIGRASCRERAESSVVAVAW